MTRTALTACLFLFVAPAVHAVGSDETAPPTPTETTTRCADGQVWDEETKACISADSAEMSDEDRYKTVRELAYAGRYATAEVVLAGLPAQSDAALTYRGFIARKTGDWPKAYALYHQALAINPDNILARSYLGQGHVLRGEREQATVQLAEIRARGGAGTWAEASLAKTLETGIGYDY